MGLSPKFQWLPILDIVNSFLYVVVVSGAVATCSNVSHLHRPTAMVPHHLFAYLPLQFKGL